MVSFRASRTFDPDFSVMVSEDADREREFVRDFIDNNDMRGDAGLWLALLGELQGQVAIKLDEGVNDDDEKYVVARVMPVVNLNSYFADYPRAYRATADGEIVGLKREEHEFIKLSGIWKYEPRDETINTLPILSTTFLYCRDIDRALMRIGDVNDLYARPTLVTEHKDMTDKNKFLAWARGKVGAVRDAVRWALGQMLQLVKTGGGPAAYFVQPDNSGVDALAKQTSENARQLSFISGVPPQKLARPDFQSNRSVADLSEDEALYDQQRRAWERGLLRLFRKAARLSNARGLTAGLDPGKIERVVMSALSPELTWAMIDRLREDLEKGFITRKFYLEKHPLIEDAEAMEEELAAEDEIRASRLLRSLREDREEENGEQET